MSVQQVPPAAATAPADGSPAPSRAAVRPARTKIVPTVVLALGGVYAVLPLLWVVIAATKTPEELFSTFSGWPSFNGGFTGNIAALDDYGDGRFWLWMLNSLIYAGGGAFLTVVVSAAAGYALAKYRFAGQRLIFGALLAGVLVPQITLAVPQYLLLSEMGLVGTSWSVILPSVISPYSIYLCRIYAAAAVPDEILEAGRVDGSGEFRLLWSVAVPIMTPGLVTVFLLQFISIWNNFLLPYIMLADDDLFPLTVGLYSLLNRGASQPALYSLVISGSLLSIIPIVALFLFLQRFWRLDLVAGGLKG
ncbi:multiple sugar transport system permease protein [Streptosporangium becharense]|uniref:Multiple sugar transport system permease protein n=1 Tax=Streptosporangium becharense TaxID=1816182 RepID=A0A7W9IHZ8_9ACTN|nr:carbohydrate ABC transporter permease [Streptosporangium becharense]MBB2914785.1 multiple sugar transport system permease protein [Streptosporangium becharense]MBB5820404.1 multiple sugar transport system permease protein [Streptosporangium becharense]